MVSTNPFSSNWGVGIGFMCANNSNLPQYSARIVATNYNFMQQSDMIFYTRVNNALSEKMRITSGGTIGIGTSAPNSNYKLDVIGNLHVDGRIDAKDICVSPTGFCDFVFDESYKLMSVDSLRNHISKNKHLPHFPSEKQIVKNRMSIADITLSQTRTIEELVLYTIKQEEKLQAIENELVELKKLLNT